MIRQERWHKKANQIQTQLLSNINLQLFRVSFLGEINILLQPTKALEIMELIYKI